MTDYSPDDMTDGDPGNEVDIPADDPSMEAFLARARTVVSLVDPVPADVTELAKMAYAFRDIETIESADSSELLGVRSTRGGTVRASTDEATLIWSEADGAVSGVLHSGVEVTLAVQTTGATTDVDLDDGTRAFEFRTPPGAYRLVVGQPGRTWATNWAG
ncbi:MAG: hypothetical protein ACK5PP_02560 [Acidimicrobiales bacterium]